MLLKLTTWEWSLNSHKYHNGGQTVLCRRASDATATLTKIMKPKNQPAKGDQKMIVMRKDLSSQKKLNSLELLYNFFV